MITDAYALDQMSNWMIQGSVGDQWGSAADFLELAARLVGRTGRSTDPGSIVRETAASAGCWLEGSRGWTAIPMLVRIAEGYGFPMDDDDEKIVSACENGDEDVSLEGDLGNVSVHNAMELTVEIMDKAESWMNEHVAPVGFSFGWHDGEWYLWSDEAWEEA